MIRTLLFVLLACLECYSQAPLAIPSNHQAAFARQTRDHSGLPGKAYWQNSGDYQIKITFDPSTRLLAGVVRISYHNNSPDTLKDLHFKLYPNLYQSGALRAMPIDPNDVSEGVSIKSLSINTQAVGANRMVTRGTNMIVRGCHVPPGATTDVVVDYSYTLNKGSFIRTGQVSEGTYFIAYFFPRIAVYDDIDGWDNYPYTGREEFYYDYGDFSCEITVPADYFVWSTGELVNDNDVLNDTMRSRLTLASDQSIIIDILSETELKANHASLNHQSKAWIFRATNISDMAFAVSNRYSWKSTSVVVDSSTHRRTRVDVVYDPAHKKFEPVLDYAQKTVALMSHHFPKFPFPYSHITIVEGLDAMEYPMMVNIIPFDHDSEAVELTAHEIFHTLFPFYAGLNETKFSFIDEGLATLAEFTLHESIAPSIPMNYDISAVNETAGADYDVPIITLTPQLTGKARFSNKDLKPALGFHYVREMLGPEKFNAGLRSFLETWKGKHPQPYDFFNCINRGAGVNLNWFWRDWFYNKVAPDLAISKVTRMGSLDIIEVRKIGSGMVPVHLSIQYTDGTRESRVLDISCWSKGNAFVTITGRKNKHIQRLELGGPFDVDIDKSNNSWRR